MSSLPPLPPPPGSPGGPPPPGAPGGPPPPPDPRAPMPSFPLEEAEPRPAAAPQGAPPFQQGAPGPFAPGGAPPYLLPGQAGPPQGGPDSSGVATQAALRRKSLVLPIIVLVLLSIPAFWLPLSLLSAGGSSGVSPARTWEYFKEGGLGMWIITACLSLTLLSLLVMGTLRMMGKRLPGALLFVPPLLPFTAGSLAAIYSEKRIVEIIGSAGIDPDQRIRILAEGLSELSNLFVYGGLASATCMYIAATAATMSILSVDTARVAAGPKSMIWLASIGGAFVALLLSVGVRFGLHIGFTAIDVLVILGLLSAGLLATLGGRSVRLLAENRAEDEASRAFRLLALTAFAMAATMLFLDRASVSAMTRLALGALSGESVDPSQRATILAEVVAEKRSAPIGMFVDVLGCVLIFGAPIAAGARVMRRFSYSAVAAGAAGALVFFLGLAANARIDSDVAGQRASVEKVEEAMSAAGITLPKLGNTDNAAGLSDARWLLIKTDGALTEIPATPPAHPENDIEDVVEDPQVAPSANVAADASLTAGGLLTALGPAIKSNVQAPVLLVGAPQGQSRLNELGPWAGLVGSSLAAYPVRVVPKLAEWIKPTRETDRLKYQRTLAILPSANAVKLVLWSGDSPAEVQRSMPETLPLGDSFQDTDRRRDLLGDLQAKYGTTALLLAPLPDEKIDKVVQWLAALAASQSSRREGVPVVLTTDRATLEQAPTGARSRVRLVLGQVLVIGHLAKDPVAEALKQALPTLEKCAARRTEETHPAVFMTLRFSVDKAGKASRVGVKQSPGKEITDCLSSTVESLSWPAADKGLASVTASIDLR